MTLAALGESDILRLGNLVADRHATGTRENYRCQWRIWTAWANYREVAAIPAASALVGAFLAERAEFGIKPATLRVAAAAISHHHIMAGIDSPIDRSVRDILGAIERLYGGAQKQAAAIRVTACAPRRGRGGNMETEEYAHRRGLADIALASVMRDGMLRIGEAASLIWADLDTRPDGSGRLVIRKSKTDQTGAGAAVYLSRATISAVSLIREDADDVGRIFGLSARQMSNRIKATARAAGLGESFSGHSARVGMARCLVRQGTELAALMTAGRWKSHDMPARYTRAETLGRGAVARYHGEG